MVVERPYHHCGDDIVFTSQFVPTNENKPPKSSYAVVTREVKNTRLQDADLLVMSDEGFALSMHQPWASLLVAGIKKFVSK